MLGVVVMASDGEEEIIRELCAGILRLPVFGYLRSGSFVHFCREYGLEDIWNACVARVQHENRMAEDFEAYDDRYLGKIFFYFVVALYDRRYADFVGMIGRFLSGAYHHTRERFPLTEFDRDAVRNIESALVELGSERSEIQEQFSGFSPKNAL